MNTNKNMGNENNSHKDEKIDTLNLSIHIKALDSKKSNECKSIQKFQINYLTKLKLNDIKSFLKIITHSKSNLISYCTDTSNITNNSVSGNYIKELDKVTLNIFLPNLITLSKDINSIQKILDSSQEYINLEKLLMEDVLNYYFLNNKESVINKSLELLSKCFCNNQNSQKNREDKQDNFEISSNNGEFSHRRKTNLFYLLSSSMLGAFLGDSLGSYYEFQKGSEFLFDDKIVFKQVNPLFNTSPGQITDDSEMALSCSYGILDNLYSNCNKSLELNKNSLMNLINSITPTFNYNKIGYYYYLWYLSGPFDIGNTTSNGLSAVLTYEYKKTTVKYDQLQYKENYYYDIISKKTESVESLSNGFLMRKTPIAVFSSLFINYKELNSSDHKKINQINHKATHFISDSIIEKINMIDNQFTHNSNQTHIAADLYSHIITRIIYLRVNKEIKSYEDIKLIAKETLAYLKYKITEKINEMDLNKKINDISETNSKEGKKNNNKEVIQFLKDLVSLINYDYSSTSNIDNLLKDYFTPENYYKHMGYFFHAFALIIKYLVVISDGENKREYSYIEIIKESINLGGDTDTNACIVGGVVGVLFGIELFDLDYLKTLVCCNPITSKYKRSAMYSPVFALLYCLKISDFIEEMWFNKTITTDTSDFKINNICSMKSGFSECYSLECIYSFLLENEKL